MSEKNWQTVAWIISRLSGSFSILPFLVAFVLSFYSGISPGRRLLIFVVALLSYHLLPVGYFLFFRYQGWISDIDVTQRTERGRLLLLIVLTGWVGFVAGFFVGATPTYLYLTFLWMVTISVVALITKIEKVSLHMVAATSTYLIFNYLLDWDWWWAGIALIPIAWSRWYQQKHTPGQLLLGVLVSVVIFLTGFILMLK